MPSLAAIFRKHWSLLSLNQKLEDAFDEYPVMAYKRCRNLKDYLGSNTIENNKVKRSKHKKMNGSCKPCFGRTDALCCKQVITTDSFRSNTTQKSYKIFHHLNCKSKYAIYLMECNICKLQYVGKTEWPMNIRINNHRKDCHQEYAIPAIRHFSINGHSFNNNAKFTIIEQLKDTSKSIEKLREILEFREDFWILKLETLHPFGLNDKLNHPNRIFGLNF